MSARGNREDVRRRLEERYRRLADARKKSPAAAVAARFTEIDGGTLGGIVSIQLFTTVIPLIIIGFDYLSGFAENESPGALIIRELGLVSPLTERVRAAFGDSSAFRTSWTFIGVAGFLVWGMPMSITIAGIFAKAWRREQFGLGGRLLRGATWFVLYLIMIGPGAGLDLLVAHPGSAGPRRRPGLALPRAGRAGRGGDRRNHHSANRPDRLPAVAQRLERFRPDRCRDGINDVVRGDRQGWVLTGVRGYGHVGAHGPVRDGHRVTERRIGAAGDEEAFALCPVFPRSA